MRFLNTKDISNNILELIENAESEILIAVPYIQTSERIIHALRNADSRGVETLIIYKENKLNTTEWSKFSELECLTLLAHPNLHAKCYMNEFNTILTSMNMYEYSERNNREFGVLVDTEDFEDFSEDVKKELQSIVNSCEDYSLKSKKVESQGLLFKLLKTKEDYNEEFRNELSNILNPKKIEISVNEFNHARIVCNSFYDRVDVDFTEKYRWIFTLDFDTERIERIFFLYQSVQSNEFLNRGHRAYWNRFKSPIYLYPSKSFIFNSSEEQILHLKDGAFDLISILKDCIKQTM